MSELLYFRVIYFIIIHVLSKFVRAELDNRFHDSLNGTRLAELITCLMGKVYINFIVLPEILLLKLMSVPAINLG